MAGAFTVTQRNGGPEPDGAKCLRLNVWAHVVKGTDEKLVWEQTR